MARNVMKILVEEAILGPSSSHLIAGFSALRMTFDSFL